MNSTKPASRLDAYNKLTSHERSLWMTTIAIVLMTGATVALLTVTAHLYGAFEGGINGYLLAGICLLLLSIFMAYLAANRQKLEESRAQILRELQSRQVQLSETNQALQASLRTREDFLNRVSHELKTPLTAMIAYAEFLTDETLSADEKQRHLNTVLAEGKSLLHLIGQLVDVSSLQSGVISLRWEQGDLLAAVSVVRDRLQADPPPSDALLELDLPAEPIELWCDAARISDAIETLLRDTMAHAAPGASVLLRVHPEGNDWVEVDIIDPAREVTPEVCAALFTPFAGIDGITRGRAGDLGLSLPLAQRLIMAHGGLLEASPRAHGGLGIRIMLPRDNAGRREAEAEPEDEELRQAS